MRIPGIPALPGHCSLSIFFSSDVFITSTCGIDEVGEGEVKGWGIKGLSQAGGFSIKSCQTKI